MMQQRANAQAGFTLLEVLLVVFIGGLAGLLGLRLLTTTDDLGYASRMQLRASASYRAAHAAVARVLRNASATSLAGFDAQGQTETLEFQVVEGAEAGALVLGPTQRLAYERTTGDLGGAPAGRLVLTSVDGGTSRAVLDGVREDTFRLRLEGRCLVLRMGIVQEVEGGAALEVEGETVISLRN